jgi:hypothetical protein
VRRCTQRLRFGTPLAWVDALGRREAQEGKQSGMGKIREGAVRTNGRGRCKQDRCRVTAEGAQGAALHTAGRMRHRAGRTRNLASGACSYLGCFPLWRLVSGCCAGYRSDRAWLGVPRPRRRDAEVLGAAGHVGSADAEFRGDVGEGPAAEDVLLVPPTGFDGAGAGAPGPGIVVQSDAQFR